MLSSKLRLFRRKTLLCYIRGRRRNRLTKDPSHVPLHSWMTQNYTWHPAYVINFLVTSMEALNSPPHGQRWIAPEKIVLENEHFDLGLLSQQPAENMQRMVQFPQLRSPECYTVEHWNFSALGSILDNYLGWSHQATRGKSLERRHLIQMICLRSMKAVIDGFVEGCIMNRNRSAIGYLECYVILRRLSLQVNELEENRCLWLLVKVHSLNDQFKSSPSLKCQSQRLQQSLAFLSSENSSTLIKIDFPWGSRGTGSQYIAMIKFPDSSFSQFVIESNDGVFPR